MMAHTATPRHGVEVVPRSGTQYSTPGIPGSLNTPGTPCTSGTPELPKIIKFYFILTPSL